MRQEIEAIIEAEGLTKASIGKMRKVDSFIKESLRIGIGGGAFSISNFTDEIIVLCNRLQVQWFGGLRRISPFRMV